ncbi:MAG: glycan-binding surface protein, partial [Cyclobacteriaceae bacterium]
MKSIKSCIYNPAQLLRITMVMILAAGLFACQDEELGTPEITGIRITNPESADSLFNESSLGHMVVIMGRNLGSTYKVMFNDVEAYLNPNYITNTNIILSVPGDVPTEVTDQITLMTKGGMATYSYSVNVPPPSIQRVNNEFAADGTEMTFTGNYFFDAVVTFPGDVEGVVVSEEQTKLVVVVPNGAEKGRIKIETLFGEVMTPFIFRDDTYMIVDFDDKGKCWGEIKVVDASEDPTPEPVSGNYARALFEDIGPSSWWNDGWVIAHCGDLGVTGNAANFMMKFEINVLEAWNHGWYEIQLGDYFYRFQPWAQPGNDNTFKTNGWVTVSIPMTSFRQKVDGSPTG